MTFPIIHKYIVSIKDIINQHSKNLVLIIGSGGREHALGWKLRQSSYVKKVFFAPGNAGTAQIGENIDIDSNDIQRLLEWAIQNKIDFTLVGPETSLALGIVDMFTKHNLKIFGPSKVAAQLESSKTWAIKFMKRHAIPHPSSEFFMSPQKAKRYLESVDYPVVIKADGLAAGKGVVIPETKKDSIQAVEMLMIDKKFGNAGNKILIQEKLSGEEISLLAFTDGNTIVPLLPAQDHKRINDNDQGLNTGGVGAYAPVLFVNKDLEKQIYNDILLPTIKGLQKDKIEFVGIIYVGLILTEKGPKVIEYNVRFGDPETQPLMMLLKSDLYDILNACVERKLFSKLVKFKKGSSLSIIACAKGYPETFIKGNTIYGIKEKYPNDICVFHCGTQNKNGKYVTSGGRVLAITAYSKSIKDAQTKAYAFLEGKKVFFKDMHYRRDIGKRSLF